MTKRSARPFSGTGRDWLAGVFAAACAAAAFLGAALLYANGQQQKENERLALFWNRYASMYYEMNGGWSGLAERLAADWNRYGGDGEAVAVWAAGAAEPVAAAGDRRTAVRSGGKPVLADGRIVGHTRAAAHSGRLLDGSEPALALVVAGLTFSGWLAADNRRRRRLQRPLDRLAGRVMRLAETRYDVGSEAALRPRPRSSSAHGEGAYGEVARGGAHGEGAAGAPGRWPSAAHSAIRRDASQVAEAEAALDRLEERLRRLETVRRTMVADIAHELRTPIAVMRAQLDHALQSGDSLPPAKIATLHDEAYRMSKLVRDLQELALADSGRLPLEMDWFSLSDMLASIVETLGAAAETDGVAVRLDCPGPVQIYADRIRIQQVFVNLLGNAIRHGRTEVAVTAGIRDGEIEVAIADDGIGIEEEELPRLFDRFYRGGASVAASGGAGDMPSGDAFGGGAAGPDSRKAGGLGLGLAIAKEYVTAHGGTIAVSSRWGEGTVFTVRLPVMTPV